MKKAHFILDGNPADSSLTDTMLDRQKDIYGRYPLKVALDGGFASHDNLKKAKNKGIKDVCFSKVRGLEAEDMCRSECVYKRLRRFRAGIESAISLVKRAPLVYRDAPGKAIVRSKGMCGRQSSLPAC